MEEGLNDERDLKQHFEASGTNELIAINDEKLPPSHLKWFQESAEIQKTWSGIINIIQKLTRKLDVLDYQKAKLCRDEEFTHCLLEFSPFPWKNMSNNAAFQEVYGQTRKQIRGARIKQFKDVLEKYNPKLVVFYSLTMKKIWKKIVDDVQWQVLADNKVLRAEKSGTTYFIIPHTTWRYMSKSAVEKVLETFNHTPQDKRMENI